MERAITIKFLRWEHKIHPFWALITNKTIHLKSAFPWPTGSFTRARTISGSVTNFSHCHAWCMHLPNKYVWNEQITALHFYVSFSLFLGYLFCPRNLSVYCATVSHWFNYHGFRVWVNVWWYSHRGHDSNSRLHTADTSVSKNRQMLSLFSWQSTPSRMVEGEKLNFKGEVDSVV